MSRWRAPVLGVLLAAALTVSALTALDPASAAPAAVGTWQPSIAPHPTEGNGTLTEVSCSQQDACVALGTATVRSGDTVQVAERWDGTTWTNVAVPRPPVKLASLSCASPTACAATAVGTYYSQPLAYRLGATGWTRELLPSPPGADSVAYHHLSCPTTGWCLATGLTVRGHARAGVTAIWDGTDWSPGPRPDVVPISFGAVSCAAPGSCLAIGQVFATGPDGRRYERSEAFWLTNGAWSMTAPVARPTPYVTLVAVSCAGVSACTAVGTTRGCQAHPCYRGARVLAERWDGSTWTVQPVPQKARRNAFLSSVSCPAADFCAAAGRLNSNSRDIVTWDGAQWTLQTAPVEPYVRDSLTLGAVSCAQRTCQAVGGYLPAGQPGPSDRPQMLVRQFDADGPPYWRAPPVHQPVGPVDYRLTDVSCLSTSDCTSVGTAASAAGRNALYVARWDGARWRDQYVPVEVDGAAGNQFAPTSVSCSAAAHCMVVGLVHAGADPLFRYAAAVALDGQAATVRRLASDTGARAVDVACTAPDACTAALSVSKCLGCYATRPGLERWDGTSWQVQSPGVQDTPQGLLAVSCAAADECAAVGVSSAQRWDGTTWRSEDLPVPQGGGLTDVSCPAPGECMAVGARLNHNFAFRLHGGAWTAVPLDTGHAGLNPYSVSCVSADACSAIGTDLNGEPAADRWDGTAWSAQSIPAERVDYVGISCVAPDTCMAVGSGAVLTEGF